MRIERAEPRAVPEIMRLIEMCVAQMRSQGNFQWDEVYPSQPIFEEDARAGTLFVVREDGQGVACVCLNDTPSPEYQSVSWSDPGGAVLIIHRLAVHPQWQRRGIARQILVDAEQYARERGFACLRLDVYTGNPRAMALYPRQGYRRAGQVWFPRRPLPFDCFEKHLS